MDLLRFKSLTARQRALISIAVLIDGHDAGMFLENDSINGQTLSGLANELADLAPGLRMPLAGTLLREALDELK